MANLDDKDSNSGLYRKFEVTRVDGSSAPGGRHHGCQYFVLDVTHDPHAVPALRAYIASCAGEYPLLAEDLTSLLPA